MTRFVEKGPGHFVLRGDKFYISYIDKCKKTFEEVAKNLPDRSETALVLMLEGRDVPFILEGDFRDEYEARVDLGFYACFFFYKDHCYQKELWDKQLYTGPVNPISVLKQLFPDLARELEKIPTAYTDAQKNKNTLSDIKPSDIDSLIQESLKHPPKDPDSGDSQEKE